MHEWLIFVISSGRLSMKIGSCSQGQFLQADFVTEFLHAAKATFYYCLTVAFIKVVGAEVGISLFAS